MADCVMTNENKNTLWTRDFTIITIGSVVSMLGNSLVGFALSLMVLDYTSSSILYAIYMVTFTFPQLVTPIFSGALLDRFSRKKVIYTLDFISAGIYMFMAVLLFTNKFSFVVFAIICFVLGIINSTYMVAYESLYPLLITEGNYQKAYSISSMLETMTAVMVPVSTFIYNMIGIAPLMVINAFTFLIAAIVETQIKHQEEYVEKRSEEKEENASNVKTMLSDIKEGMLYLKSERGLLAIGLYFFFTMLSAGSENVLALPYYKQNFSNGEYLFILVMGMVFLGRAVGGGIHYKIKLPAKHKYMIAMCIYIIVNIADGTFMFWPIPVAMGVCLVNGLCGVTSYTIRISSTQAYVPDDKKGRFNGAFLILVTSGMLVGELLAGALGEVMDPRFVQLTLCGINLLMAFVLIGGNHKEVAKIYNTDN